MPERVFLDWAEPTAPAVARWLRDQPGSPLILVPTRQAGRRLRAALGRTATIHTPAEFLSPPEPPDPVQAALLLAADLAAPRARRLTALFPAGVPARDFRERLGLARDLLALRAELAENGLTPAAAAARFAAGSIDAARWSDLARLLERATREDPEAARLAFAANPRLPDHTDAVVVAAVPDLQPIVAQALERLGVAITVLVPGPAEPDAFDAWGRPLAAAWADRDPGWRDFDGGIHLVARPDQLDLPAATEPGLEIGVLDRDLLPSLRASLGDRPLHDPTGQPVTRHWLPRALAAIAGAGAEPTFDRAVELLRNGVIRAWLGEQDLEAALLEADAIRAAHFPATLRGARPWVRRGSALDAALEPLERAFTRLREDPVSAAAELTAELGAAFQPLLDEAGVAQLKEARAALDAALSRLSALAAEFPRLSAPDWLHALSEALAPARLYPPRPPGAVEASGWLELPWSEAPHLVLAGLNLGRLPLPLGGELFLTENARATLGIAGAPERRARDAYLLARLLAQRRAGAVHGLVAQLDAEGSPLQPSPLLFAGAGAALPARVERLFAEPRPPHPDPAWVAGWRFDPPVLELSRRVSVTDFSRYLDCPFTFYLARIAGMRTFAPAADELDAAQFGDLMHVALEGWANDDAAARSTDPAIIQAALDAHLDAWVAKQLGRRLSLPLRVQIDSGRRRLHAFAEWQARDAHDGWRVQGAEKKFEEILGRPWEVDGWVIAGKVDRLDRNERDGRWRVVDYKTFDAPDNPAKKHLRAFRTTDRPWPPDYARVADGAPWWINLQLPLYRQLLIEHGCEPHLLACGYFNLPKTIADTGLQTWDELDEPLQASALTCARGVLADMGRRRFWPPNPRAEHAEFAEFFPPEPGRIVDPEGAFRRSCAA